MTYLAWWLIAYSRPHCAPESAISLVEDQLVSACSIAWRLWERLKNIASHGISYVKCLTDPPGLLPGPLFPDTSVLSELFQLFAPSETVGLSLKPLRAWVLATQGLLFSWTIMELSRLVWDLTTPLTSSGGTGRQDSVSKWSLAWSWLPQIFRPKRKAFLSLQPTVQSHLKETATHTSITTVATSSSYCVSHPVLAWCGLTPARN